MTTFSRTLTAVCALVCGATAAAAQTRATVPLTRADATRLALEHAPRGALARADSAAAIANLLLARQFENPTLSASYSKSDPKGHFSLDIPFDWPSVRQSRAAAAGLGVSAVSLRTTFGRAALTLDVDTAYTRAQAVAAHAALTARTARDSDSLLVIVTLRRDAGDASDLDVELARVFAGQSANTAANDSLAAIAARAILQSLIGLSLDSVQVSLSEALIASDSAAGFSVNTTTGSATPITGAALSPANQRTASSSFLVAAAEREAEAARYRVLIEQRRRISAPSLSVGFEAFDATSKGIMPTIGIGLPLPLFNRNLATIQLAQAELSRARANLNLVRLEQATALAAAQRDASATRARLARSTQLVASANRIAALSLVAYREGATPLSTALDAQRSAREVLAQYVDDIATARIAESVLRLFSLSTVGPVP